MEAYLEMYGINLINEEFHPEIKSIMDSDKITPENKLNQVTKKARSLIAAGHDTGMESDKPKKGSSRAVFFPKQHKEIEVDGAKTKAPTAVKIAHAGWADKILKKHDSSHSLLGEDHFLNQHHGVLHETANGKYATNPHGILAPVFHSHDEGHHIEMGRADKFNERDFKEGMKTKEYPKGISHEDFKGALQHYHNMAHGRGSKNEKYDHMIEHHPIVSNAADLIGNGAIHPGDFEKRNMGIYKHPVTGHKHPVLIDWGSSNDVMQKYSKARKLWKPS